MFPFQENSYFFIYMFLCGFFFFFFPVLFVLSTKGHCFMGSFFNKA